MNASLSWLRAIAPGLENDAHAIAHRLAMLGAPVDEIVDVGGALADVRIGKVIEAGRHPNADRLSLCRVDAGTGELLDVVCGAPNVRAGAFYPFAPVGATLPGGITIKKAKIRGETSNGMLCSARELGLGRDHEGILELSGEFTPGASFTEVTGLDDVRIVIDITPNRPDLLSHWGIARELAPGGQPSLVLPAIPGANGKPAGLSFTTGRTDATASGVRVASEDVSACPRYYGVIIRGVRVGPSPEWLASRLRAIGARPINNIVDVTNWVLHELGQPQHAFDLDALGPNVVVRAARSGERLVTLDGEERKLTPDVLAITDGEKPVALAGIMGGEATEVRATTQNVLLECALFDPKTIRRGRRLLEMSTDASYRFERGVDPDGMERAVRRAVDLILATAGGKVEPAVPVVDAGVEAISPVRIRASRAAHVLGIAMSDSRIASLLEPIGFERMEGGTDTYRIPSHRRYDVQREVDLIEEVARREGYAAFPDDLRPFRPSVVPDDPMSHLEDRLRTAFVAQGFLEARSSTFAPESDGDVALLLPLSAAEGRLRRAILPGLIRRLEANYNRGARDVRLFEIGTVFAPGQDAIPVETTHLAAILTGGRRPGHWTGEPGAYDVWDLRGLAESVAAQLGLTLEPEGDSPLLAASATFTLRSHDGTVIGTAGRLRDSAVDAPAWAEPVFGMELTIDTSMVPHEPTSFQALPAHPAVERDLALIVVQGVSAAAIGRSIRDAAGALLEGVQPFDVYTGEGIPAGSRSLAFRLRFRAPDRTLTDEEVDGTITRVLSRLREEHNVERR